MRVLIAEDSAPSRMLLQVAVETLGYDCLVAADGGEAWELYQAHTPDVIISDVDMPVLNGLQLCGRVRRDGLPYVYFIFLTTLDDQKQQAAGMQAGADDYLAKPLKLNELRLRLIAAERVTSLHQQLAEKQADREEALLRREALLRVARRFAAEADAERMLTDLLEETAAVMGGVGAVVLSWHEERGGLVAVRMTSPLPEDLSFIPLGHGPIGQAAQKLVPVIVNRDDNANLSQNGSDSRVQACIGVPLLHEGRLIGALGVLCDQPDKRFDHEDAEVLELLAGTAAAALQGLEQARLSGVLLTARTAQHEINNKLTTAVGYAELLASDARLPKDIQDLARQVLHGTRDAADILGRLRAITRVHETHWGPSLGSTIDLARST